jgi:DNA-binding transcriptional ArsR family regulator
LERDPPPGLAVDIRARQHYLAVMRNSQVATLASLRLFKALASETRLRVLAWLRDPVANFPAQVDGDLVKDGVCADFIREKLGIAAATASRHLTLLTEAGLLIATRRKGWTFYRRDEPAIRRFTRQMHTDL